MDLVVSSSVLGFIVLFHANEVIILEVSVDDIASGTAVLTIPVHLVVEPFSLVVAVIGPGVDSFPLAVSILEVALVDVSIGETVFP